MRRGARSATIAALLGVLVSTVGCSASFPEPPRSVGEGYPESGIPVSTAWPSDWLEGFVGEPNSPPGEIVGLRLEFAGDRWVWRVRSPDPGRDVFGESITDPDRGWEGLYDASTLTLVAEHHVDLTAAESAEREVSAYDAAQLSGEVYPSPRLIELERVMLDDRPTWRITTRDTDTGEHAVVTLDAD